MPASPLSEKSFANAQTAWPILSALSNARVISTRSLSPPAMIVRNSSTVIFRFLTGLYQDFFQNINNRWNYIKRRCAVRIRLFHTLAFSPAISPAPSFVKAKHLLPGGGSEEAAERPDAGRAEHARRAALAVEGHGRLTETARAPSSRCRSPRPWDGSRRPSARAVPIPFRPRAAR